MCLTLKGAEHQDHEAWKMKQHCASKVRRRTGACHACDEILHRSPHSALHA